ncbi:MAG TPA: hypothetical protein VH880_08700 [Anaeromyxobacteraceae bacterium]|jgi:hypothetical protein
MTGPDRLEELLAGEPHLDDGGFTERVLARLPPRRRDHWPLVMSVSAAAAAGVAAAELPALLAWARAALSAAPAGVPPSLLAAAGATLLAAAVAALAMAAE